MLAAGQAILALLIGSERERKLREWEASQSHPNPTPHTRTAAEPRGQPNFHLQRKAASIKLRSQLARKYRSLYR